MNPAQLTCGTAGFVQVYIRMNSFFTSLERLLEYETLPQENLSGEIPLLSEWPSEGEIVFIE